jgi:hypothetical protein
MRPIYETPGDRAREAAVVEAFASHYSLETIKLPPRYPLDFAVVRPASDEDGTEMITAFGEVKVRTHAFGAYPTAMLSLSKWADGMALVERTGTRFILLIGWSLGEDVRWVDLTTLTGPPRIAPGGRQDRDDAQDQDAVVHIPLHVFRQIPGTRKPEPEAAPEPPDNRTQEELLASAKRMAFAGQEFGKLVARLDPNSAARLKAFVQSLPTEVRLQTIYGRSNPPAASKTPQKRS